MENLIKLENRETFNCECVDCGYTQKSKKHCKDLKCPKCGGQMRRKDRPGTGKKDCSFISAFLKCKSSFYKG